MKYEVTFECDGIFHSNLAMADSEKQVAEYFEDQNRVRNKTRKLIDVREATSDSERRGKPVIYCNRS